MHQANTDFVLDMPPDAALIEAMRERAQSTHDSVVATYVPPGSEPFYVVVSDRGTCVLLRDAVTVQTFNRDMAAEEVAEGMQHFAA